MWGFVQLDRFPRSLATVSLLMVIIAATALASFVVVSGLLDSGFGGPSPSPSVAVEPTPAPGEWAALTASAQRSSVAIQTFSGDRVIRSGTGTVVSADGLIATVIDVVPYIRGAGVQVVTDDRVLRAFVVVRDTRTNVALLKVETSDLAIAPFVRAHPPVGTPVALVGGFVDVASYRPLFAHGWVSRDMDTYSVLDAGFQDVLGGARVLTPQGQQVGIVFLRGTRVLMVRSEQIQEVIDTYLDGLNVGA